MYKVLIIEDHALVRFGLKTAFESNSNIEKIYEASNAEDGIEKVKQEHPDAVIIDLGLPNMNGIDAAKIINQINKDIKIIILTSHNSEEEVISAVKAGARAYCSKDINPDKLADVIVTVMEGAVWFDSNAADIIINAAVSGNGKKYSLNESYNLTEREKEVLDYICKGLTNNDIAKILDVSINTVKVHVSSIIQKLGVEDRTQVVVKAYNQM